MNYELLAPFSIGMLILAASPGPGVLGSVSKAVSSGFVSSLFFIGGLVLGDIIFMIMAVLGLSVISQIMGELFFMIKVAGGLYLIYLGIKTLRAKQTARKIEKDSTKDNLKTSVAGFLVTMGNPKPILFYASVLPTILNINDIKFIDGTIMVLLIALISFAVIGTYCWLASIGRKVMQKKKLFDYVNKGAGVVMISTGAYIVIK